MSGERSNGQLKTRVAVIGASGFVGGAVFADLASAGVETIPLPAPRLIVSAGVVQGRALSELAAEHPATSALSQRLLGVDVIVNAAGLASPGSGSDDRLFGANSLLPAVVVHAAARAGVRRVVHVSSAAVQGRRDSLDETTDVAPFSPYSTSKARGEAALVSMSIDLASPEVVIVRATSVQGAGRDVTARLQSLAQSRLASVAGNGNQPSAVSSVGALARLVRIVACSEEQPPLIVLQPWEGLSVRDVLQVAGGRSPRSLPPAICRLVLSFGFSVGRVLPRILGVARRLEMMWFGQEQTVGWGDRYSSQLQQVGNVRRVLSSKEAMDSR